MFTQLESLGPLCRAAIITFKPFSSFLVFTIYFLIGAVLIKLAASFLKTYFSTKNTLVTTSHSKASQNIAKKYNFPIQYLYILDSDALLAFSSILPGITNGIFLSKGLFKQLTVKQQEAVFLHELHHWKSRQTFPQLLIKLIADVFFFFSGN